MPTLAQSVLPFDCVVCGLTVDSVTAIRGAKPHLRRRLCGPCKGRVNYAERTGRTVDELRPRRPNGRGNRLTRPKSTVGQSFPCRLCGRDYVKRSDNNKYCSPECVQAAERQHGVKVIQAPCDWCGKHIERKRYKSNRGWFCDHKCRMAYKVCVTNGMAFRAWPKPNPWQYAKDRRDYIIHRDGGRCVACRKKVVIGKPRHPKAAEIDHIVPVSLWPKGQPGLNDPSNLRLLCRTCNSQKSNGTVPGGDQLLLVG